MNLNSTRLMLRSCFRVIKAYRCKLSKDLPVTLPRFSVASHSRCFSWQRTSSQDSKDDFELFEDATKFMYKEPNVEEITGGDLEKTRMLKICQMEIDLSFQKGSRVPKTMTTEQWCELIKLQNRGERSRFVKFLWLCEVRRDNFKRKKIDKRQNYLEEVVTRDQRDRAEIPTNAPVKYGLCDTSLVHRIRDVQINKFYNYKLLQAMMYGPHILVDCGYEAFMNRTEISLCTQQLVSMWYDNRDSRNPFDVIFCNFKETNVIFRKLQKILMALGTDPSFPFNYTDKHYLNLFPRENLVYLTPHCDTYLKNFDGNDIYIIGAMVEQSTYEPISLAKAKKDRIRYAKLPLDLFLNWKQGTKSLTLNQCLAIMNDIKDGRDWSYAFRHVPENELKVLTNTIDEKNYAKPTKKPSRRNKVDDLFLATKKS